MEHVELLDTTLEKEFAWIHRMENPEDYKTMTQEQALESLITFAPTWKHSVERRIAYYVTFQEESQWTIFTVPDLWETPGLFRGTNLEELITSAKNFIYLSRLEQTLTQPVYVIAEIQP